MDRLKDPLRGSYIGKQMDKSIQYQKNLDFSEKIMTCRFKITLVFKILLTSGRIKIAGVCFLNNRNL